MNQSGTLLDGITPVPEMLNAGIDVAFGHDCVMDPWYPLGSADMLEVAHGSARRADDGAGRIIGDPHRKSDQCGSSDAFCGTPLCVACRGREKSRHNYVTARKLKGPPDLHETSERTMKSFVMHSMYILAFIAFALVALPALEIKATLSFGASLLSYLEKWTGISGSEPVFAFIFAIWFLACATVSFAAALVLGVRGWSAAWLAGVAAVVAMWLLFDHFELRELATQRLLEPLSIVLGAVVGMACAKALGRTLIRRIRSDARGT